MFLIYVHHSSFLEIYQLKMQKNRNLHLLANTFVLVQREIYYKSFLGNFVFQLKEVQDWDSELVK